LAQKPEVPIIFCNFLNPAISLKTFNVRALLRLKVLINTVQFKACGDFARILKNLTLRSKILSLEVFTVPPITSEVPQGAIVFLHGWGANAQDLASLSPLLNLPEYQFLFPNAPFPHPYVSTGRMWYNLEDAYQGLAESRQLLIEWLQSLESTTGVSLSRTILSGFSQGGAMTLDVGLNLPLAGLISLSGYLHPVTQAKTTTYPPVLLVHGRQDNVVPLNAAISAKEQLMQLGVAVQYHEFDMGHEIRPEAIPVIRDFVVTVFSEESKTSFLN